MDRFDVIRFDDLSGPKGGEWVRIGGGSFGVVFRGEYLGTEVAIKEVLPNNTYDVEKYFERECVLMKEARHPNIVQYIGLTKSPGHDGRIYIVSEFVGPNLRQHIADKNKSMGWPLRMSFATDIARAVAYLHARNCMHRDLKGENLLITDNQRIKVCDFGFARIAARNEEEMRRISYCGTDGYMSPEILLGVDFGLPSDIFSLGIIFCEIISRHLVDPKTFKRQMPSFGLDEDEVREMASEGCPTDFIDLCLEMTRVDPDDRPDMRHVIRRLRAIEQEVVQREYSKGTMSNIGSVRGSSLTALIGNKSSKRSSNSRRLPSFNGSVAVSQLSSVPDVIAEGNHGRNASDSSDEDVEEALQALEQLSLGNGAGTVGVAESIRAASTFKAAGHGNPWWDDASDSSSLSDLPASWLRQDPPSSTSTPWKKAVQEEGNKADTTPQTSTIKTAMPKHRSTEDEYSTSIVRPSRKVQHPSLASSLSKMTGSTVNIKRGNEAAATATPTTSTVRVRAPLGMMMANGSISRTINRDTLETETVKNTDECDDATQSFMTARSVQRQGHDHEPSFAMATIASSIFERSMLYHRFTLVKNGVRKTGADASSSTVSLSSNKMPYQLILANALTKCNVCLKRLGFSAYMDCDDCPYKTHIACADMAEPNCHEMHIPGSQSPSSAGSPAMSSPKWLNTPERSTSVEDVSEKEKEKENEVAVTRTPTPVVRVGSPKISPSSLSKGVAMFRKRNSKSPPPQRNGTSTASIVRA